MNEEMRFLFVCAVLALLALAYDMYGYKEKVLFVMNRVVLFSGILLVTACIMLALIYLTAYGMGRVV